MSRMSKNPFKSMKVFSQSLKSHRKETLELLAERKIDELMQDGIRDVIGCLARWMTDGLNFGDDDILCGLAESLIEEEE